MALSPFPVGRRLRSAPAPALLRREAGQSSAEYAGIIVVAVVLILALLATSTSTGQQIASGVRCTIEGIFSNAGSAACGTEPAPVTVGRAEGDRAAGPSDADGGSPRAPAEGRPQETEPGQAVDQNKVNDALKGIREDLSTGWFNPVSEADLARIEGRLQGLNGAEVDAVIAGMSDDELRRWVEEMEQGWGLFGSGGWSTERRQQMWSQALPDASYETVRRLAGLTNDIQPRYDDVGGDDANENGKGSAFTYQESEGAPVVNGVSSTDISQGTIGDCWYIAALKAVADADPSVIEKAITDNGNGTYTVRLYRNGQPLSITVTGDQVVNQSDGRQSFARSANKDELWPQIMEKALASYEGSYGAIEGGWSSNGMEVLTGKPSTTAPTGNYSAANLKAALDQGHAVALSSHPKPWWPWWSEDNPLYQQGAQDSRGNSMSEPLYRNHAYHVTAVDLGDPADPSDDTVTVQNPWYGNQPMTLPYEDWKKGFSQVHINPVK